MATAGTFFPVATQSSTPSASTASNAASAAQADPLANESAFLQLLVAQMQYQDPTQPMDGTTFVTQLAEFAGVEQDVAMRTDLDDISSKYVGVNSSSTTTSGSSAAAGSSATTDAGAGANNQGSNASNNTTGTSGTTGANSATNS